MLSVVLVFALLPPCVGLAPPVEGPIVEGFAPIGRYAGHWGIDLAADVGTPVRAADGGSVSFSGIVVGNRTVTIDHRGLKTSYSYLTATLIRPGARVRRGEVIGRSGVHRGRPALHFSARVDGSYVDPERLLRCQLSPGPGLWLRSAAYPLDDAGHHGWHLRSTPYGTSRRRRGCLPAARR